jgi:hypothetical protein
MKHYLNFGKKGVGRPPVIHLTDEDLREIQSYYLPTNRTKKEGSILLAWVRFCESRPELSHLVSNHMPATTIPEAVREACRRAKALVGPSRGGAPRLRHEAAYVPGTMRKHHASNRRLWAGDRASVDDATRNVACWIPWPWGGCPCSDKFGVRLGRWQTLVVHDDASSFIPYVSSVFRWAQSYRATDAAAAIYRAEREVCQFDQWSIEGGVWQAKRTLAVLGGRFISAKGRPNQKLVENYFGRLWTIMAGQSGDVGRHRGEILKNSELYVKARAGHVDPRLHFMSLTQGQEALYAAIDYLNEKRIDSRTYGTWVPKDRWENDLAEAPRQVRADADDFLILPIAKTLTVRNGSIRTTEDGPMGVPMIWTFTDTWLWELEGRKVTAYFDPLAEWPVQATLTMEGQRKPIGTVECISPELGSKDRAAEMVKAIRQTMMTEVRNFHKVHTQRILRHQSGIAISMATSTKSTPIPEIRTDRQIVREALPIIDRGNIAAAPRTTRDDIASSLSRRAALLEEAEA